jgi:hypothetical protein
MPRFATLMICLLAFSGAAHAQMWNFADGDAPRRRERDADGKPKDTTIFPLSPNRIVGRVQWVDSKGGLAIIIIERGLVYADSLLVAREDDCTPRAILAPIKMEKPSRVIACRVTHGVVRPGLEIVLPAEALLKSATTSLKANGVPEAKPAVAKAVIK